jgi:hypothetical protein
MPELRSRPNGRSNRLAYCVNRARGTAQSPVRPSAMRAVQRRGTSTLKLDSAVVLDRKCEAELFRSKVSAEG